MFFSEKFADRRKSIHMPKLKTGYQQRFQGKNDKKNVLCRTSGVHNRTLLKVPEISCGIERIFV